MATTNNFIVFRAKMMKKGMGEREIKKEWNEMKKGKTDKETKADKKKETKKTAKKK